MLFRIQNNIKKFPFVYLEGALLGERLEWEISPKILLEGSSSLLQGEKHYC
jgi:hypothetical protein